MPLTSVTRLPGGVGTVDVAAGLADLKKPFEGNYITFFDDFMPYVAANWTATGTGSAAQIAGAAGGQIAVISSAGGEEALQPPLFPFPLVVGQDFFFQTRVSFDDATLAGFFLGLSVADTSPYASAPTDGVFFRKTAGANGITAVLRSGGVDIATALLSNPLSNAVWYDFTIAFTPQDGALRASVSGIGAARLAPVTMPVGSLSPNISVFGAAARTMNVDLVYAARGR